MEGLLYKTLFHHKWNSQRFQCQPLRSTSCRDSFRWNIAHQDYIFVKTVWYWSFLAIALDISAKFCLIFIGNCFYPVDLPGEGLPEQEGDAPAGQEDQPHRQPGETTAIFFAIFTSTSTMSLLGMMTKRDIKTFILTFTVIILLIFPKEDGLIECEIFRPNLSDF